MRSEITSPVPISESHRTAAFDCGKPPLDDFLKLHALDKQRAMLSRTYVVVRDEEVVGYYTLALVSVLSADAPKKHGRGMPQAIPAMLLARLAVDSSLKGQGLGRSLFIDALQRTWSVMESGPAPVKVFVVDAMDEEAMAFYSRFDMEQAPNDPMRLFLLYKDLRLLFAGE